MPTRGMPLSRRDVEDLYTSSRDATRFVKQRRDPQPRTMGRQVLHSLEVGAGAVAVGMLAGRTGTTSIGTTGIPLGLTLGLAGHAAAFFGLGGRFAEDLHNVADGAIAGWFALWGAGRGAQARQAAGQPAAPIVAGERYDGASNASPMLPPAYPAPGLFVGPHAPYGLLDERQLANLAQEQGSPLSEAELQALAQDYSPTSMASQGT